MYIYIQLYIQHISILPGSTCKFRVGYYFQWAQQPTAVRTRPEAMMKVPQVEHAESVVLVLGSQGCTPSGNKKVEIASFTFWSTKIYPFNPHIPT